MAAPDFMTAQTEAGTDLFTKAAQAAVRRYCGWHVSPSAEVEGTVPTAGGRIVRLPLMAVSSIDGLTAPDGTDLLPHVVWTRGGILELDRRVEPSVAGIGFRATAGFDPSDVPDVVSVALQAARRAAQAPAGAVKSQSVNGASVSYGFTGDGAPLVSLLASERALLAPYRLPRLP